MNMEEIQKEIELEVESIDEEESWDTPVKKKTTNEIIYDSNKSKLSSIFGDGFDEGEDLQQVGSVPFFYASLGIAYGVEGSGKSWQIVELLGKNTDDNVLTIHLDTDGANGGKFIAHCKKYGVTYINFNNIKKIPLRNGKCLNKADIRKANKLNLVELFIKALASKRKKNSLIVIVDSLSSIGNGIAINQAQDISPVLYGLDLVGQQTSASIIVIDHTTLKTDNEGNMIGFKLEGNAGAKKRTTTSTVRYEPRDANSPQDGGIFTVERSRDADCFTIGDKFKVKGA